VAPPTGDADIAPWDARLLARMSRSSATATGDSWSPLGRALYFAFYFGLILATGQAWFLPIFVAVIIGAFAIKAIAHRAR
jgi:hypothetical protein